jgi:hypothetical protein
LSGIAADQAVIAEHPGVAGASNRRASRNFNDGVRGIIIVRRKRQLAYQQIDFRQIKARYGNIKIDVELGKVLQFNSEQSAIPAGVFSKPVISDHVSANLGLAHAGQLYCRDLIETDDFGALNATVAGNHEVCVIDQDRVDKAEPPDGVGDLGNLLFRMGAGIAPPRLQVGYVLVNNDKLSMV